jgi:cobalt/nickel transport system permease protein
MHISEGILTARVLVGGLAVAGAGVAYGLKKMDYDRMPKVAVLSSSFFVASLIHVPIGPSSVHLVLNGLMGILLGWAAFPAILVALIIQAMLFQYGGFTTIGINTVNMAIPAIVCFFLFRGFIEGDSILKSAIAGFFCGFIAIALSALSVALSLVGAGEAFFVPAKVIFAAHLPVMIIEGVITSFTVVFLKKVKPEMLEV